VRPRSEGQLVIRGVSYKVAGVAPVRRTFQFRGRRLNTTKLVRS
jgi:hypothetical protein